MRNFLLKLTVTSLFLLVFNFSASATPITNWTFNIDYGFTSYSGVDEAGNIVNSTTPGYGVVGTDKNSTFNNTPSKLKWGRQSKKIIGYSGCWIFKSPIYSWDFVGPNEISSIYVDPSSINETIQLGQRNKGITLYHDNKSIPYSTRDNNDYRTTFLKTATLSSELTITPEGLSGISLKKNFDIKFYETDNPGDDVFLIDGFNKSLSETINIGDYTYLASFEVDEFEWLETYNSYGFFTKEGFITDKQTWFSIKLVSGPNNPVPEPSTLILLGLGLFGIAGIARKKIKL